MTSSLNRRAGPLFGVVLVVGGVLAAFTPGVPAVRANDPSPTPAGEATPTPDPTAEPTPEPTPDPTPDPTAEPTPDPTAEPTPDPTPEPTTDPGPEPTPDPGVSPDPSPSADPSADPSASPEPSPTAVPLTVGHSWIDTVDDLGRLTDAGGLDEPLTGGERFTVYQVGFQLVNESGEDVLLDPALEVRVDGEWIRVPEVDPVPGVPFYAASDDGRQFRIHDTAIPGPRLRLDGPAGSTPVEGTTSAGVNPLRDLALPAGAHTEVEFAIRATLSAAWETGYQLRLVDGAEPLEGASSAGFEMGPRPRPDLSPGQRRGRNVQDALPLYRLDPTNGRTDRPNGAATRTGSAMGASYALRTTLAANAGGFDTPHVIEGLTSDTCAACHASHSGEAAQLFREPAPTTTLCFSCHDGTGAVAEVMTDWTGNAIPANDPGTSSFFSHPSTAASADTHTSGRDDEFGGVLDRHAACADCHQPHLADDTRPVNSVGGWTASGAIKGASGVAVTNGNAGSVPTYTLQATSAFEYQLCLKCHSSFTTLRAPDLAHPSRWALDKAAELNPANVSYHPVEAPGRNQSTEMAGSLAGTSPYKLWNFETNETIRCTSCHGPDLTGQVPAPPADSRLANHSSPNRGILVAPYRDRDLKPKNQGYEAVDFALCFVCHAEEPLVDGSGSLRPDTRFNWHGFHLTEIASKGTGGTDIDTFNAGQGNATCAECHFRIHSSALAVGGQAPAKGLVNFAPNVTPNQGNGVFDFSPLSATSWGSCTLTCHGKNHNGFSYGEPP